MSRAPLPALLAKGPHIVEATFGRPLSEVKPFIPEGRAEIAPPDLDEDLSVNGSLGLPTWSRQEEGYIARVTTTPRAIQRFSAAPGKLGARIPPRDCPKALRP